MTEKQVTECISQWLESNGFRIAHRPAKQDYLKYWDIRAHKPNGQQWFIEVKGEPGDRDSANRSANRRLNFLTAVGQVIVRLNSKPNAATNIGIAVPDTREWRQLMCSIPVWFKKTARVHIIFVGRDCNITVITPAQNF